MDLFLARVGLKHIYKIVDKFESTARLFTSHRSHRYPNRCWCTWHWWPPWPSSRCRGCPGWWLPSSTAGCSRPSGCPSCPHRDPRPTSWCTPWPLRSATAIRDQTPVMMRNPPLKTPPLLLPLPPHPPRPPPRPLPLPPLPHQTLLKTPRSLQPTQSLRASSPVRRSSRSWPLSQAHHNRVLLFRIDLH